MMKKVMLLSLIAIVGVAGADSITGFNDVTYDGVGLTGLTWGGTTYTTEELALGTTVRYYNTATETLPWLPEGSPVPGGIVPIGGTSSVKAGDVGSHGDNFIWAGAGAADISSIDGLPYQETLFDTPTNIFFVFERGGNDSGTVQAINADGSAAGALLTLTAGQAPTGSYLSIANVSGQVDNGYVVQTDQAVAGIRITASGHDALTICTIFKPFGGAHSPDPAGPVVLSTEVPGYAASGVSWEAPLTNSDPNGDPNLVSVNGYDVYWSAGVEPNYLIATPVVDYNYLATGESYTPTPPITYATTYYWRVDTYVTWDSNDFTGTASLDSIVEGSEWQFTTEPAYTPVVLDSFINVITTVDIGTADLVAVISGNSTPVTAEFEILTDDIEYPAGSDAVLSNVGPSASLETTLTTSVAGTYKVRATVTDSPSTPPAAVDSAIAEVVVYTDACEAKKASPGGWDPNYYDQDDDCDVDVDDLGVYARSWLDDTTLAAPESYSGGTNYGSIVIEGEHYDVFPDPNDPNNIRPDQVSGAIYELTIDAENASNGEYMYIGSNGNYSNFDQNVLDNAPRMNYTVNIETAGTYQIWIRGHSDNGNSFHFGVDGAISQNALGQDLRVTGNPSWTWWHNIQGGATADIELTAGEHTINIYQRESPCGLDKILLSPDPDYVPTGMGPAETE